MADAKESAPHPDLSGKWILEKNDENFDAYLTEMGFNWFVRKMVQFASLTVDIQQTEDAIDINTKTPKGVLQDKFKFGEEYELFNIMSQKKEKKKGFWEDNQLVIVPVENDALPVSKRELKDDHLILTLIKGKVTTKRFFKRQPD